jgi:hypothetical protein
MDDGTRKRAVEADLEKYAKVCGELHHRPMM